MSSPAIYAIHHSLCDAVSRYSTSMFPVVLAPLIPSAWWWRTRNVLASRPASFQDLPLEIQHSILGFLDWQDVLRVRQVSRTFCAMSKDRSVWLSIFHRTAHAPMPDTIYLNKKLSAHTASELEDAILAPKKADVAFDLGNATQRTVSFKKGDHIVRLLPGGRWALAWREYPPQVVIYDLESDATQLSNSVLINSPNPDHRSWYLALGLDCDFDTDSPYLSFRIAVCFSGTGDLGNGNLQVWQVNSAFDNRGNISGLSATMLSSFLPTHVMAWMGPPATLGLQLIGPYVVYASRPHSAGPPSTCIVDWRLADGTGEAFSRRYLYGISDPISILPNNYVFVARESERRIEVHDLLQLTETTNILVDQVHPRPIWEAELCAKITKEGALTPFYDATHARFFVIVFDKVVYGVEIPLNRDTRSTPTQTIVCADPNHALGASWVANFSKPISFERRNADVYLARLCWSPDTIPAIKVNVVPLPDEFVNVRAPVSVSVDAVSSRILVAAMQPSRAVICDFHSEHIFESPQVSTTS